MTVTRALLSDNIAAQYVENFPCRDLNQLRPHDVLPKPLRSVDLHCKRRTCSDCALGQVIKRATDFQIKVLNRHLILG